MPRCMRLVVPGVPHHVTQRGVRKMPTFFEEDDFELYRRLLASRCHEYGVAVWAYCLMPNHVHLVLVPTDPVGLSRALGRAHSDYARAINARKGWTGHLWQARFYSVAMQPRHTLAAVRYVVQNPVRAQLVRGPADWVHSSARDLLGMARDPLVVADGVRSWADDWAALLASPLESDALAEIRSATARGATRPSLPPVTDGASNAA